MFKVVCIDNRFAERYLEVGAIYTVNSMETRGIVQLYTGTFNSTWNVNRFKILAA